MTLLLMIKGQSCRRKIKVRWNPRHASCQFVIHRSGFQPKSEKENLITGSQSMCLPHPALAKPTTTTSVRACIADAINPFIYESCFAVHGGRCVFDVPDIAAPVDPRSRSKRKSNSRSESKSRSRSRRCRHSRSSRSSRSNIATNGEIGQKAAEAITRRGRTVRKGS